MITYNFSLKSVISFVTDVSVAIFVCMLSLYIRLGYDGIFNNREFYVLFTILFGVSSMIVDIFIQVYRDIWSYFNYTYFSKYIRYSSFTILVYTLLLVLLGEFPHFPRSILLLNFILLIPFTALPRILWKFYREGGITEIFKTKAIDKIPVLIVGLGKSTELFINASERNLSSTYQIIGILDTEENVGRRIGNYTILGKVSELEAVLDEISEKPRRILVSYEATLSGVLQDLIAIAKRRMIPLSRLPKVMEVTHNLGAAPIQPIAVEDLLMRTQQNLFSHEVEALIKDKTILVTGAGGSIGSEIVRQVLRYNPKSVILLDNSEFLLFEIEQEVQRDNITAVLSDIRDAQELTKVFESHQIDIVFHAAALKHVPMLERNKASAIKTNIIGTHNVIMLAQKYNVCDFVMISTDKAADPISFMGKTKRVAEMICQSQKESKMHISIVRFGNVLGSNGSVVPLFEKQIAQGGPITITHPEVTRYFMTIPEAVGLVIKSATIKSDNNANIYVLDMGEPIKIIDLATQMIELAGFIPSKDIEIKFTGLRDGEKIHETLTSSHELLSDAGIDGIHICSSQTPIRKVNVETINEQIIEELLQH